MSVRHNKYPTFRYWLNDESTERLPIPATIPVAGVDTQVQHDTSSLVDVPVLGMVVAPGDGDFLFLFDGVASNDAAGATVSFSLYSNGVGIGSSMRVIGGSKDIRFSISTKAVVTGLTSGQAVEVRWSVSAGTGSFFGGSLSSLRLK